MLTRRAPVARDPSSVMFGASRWRICAKLGLWGVGASGSTIARTKVCDANDVVLLVNNTVGRRAFSGYMQARSATVPCRR